MTEIESVRRGYAEAVRDKANVRSTRLFDAFSRVARERFLGPGPWRLCVPDEHGQPRYESTATAAPAEVYRDVLIAIDEARGLNNGEPSSLASWIDALDVAPGESVVHIGTGTGYYTAIFAELVEAQGRVTGFEADPLLAERARENLADYSYVSVANGSEGSVVSGSVDKIFVNCGVTHPATQWLEWLRPGGRLLFPLTAADANHAGYGAMYLALRGRGRVALTYVSRVGIYACTEHRSDDLNRKLQAKRGDDWREPHTLRTDAHVEDRSCWLHATACCLSRLQPDDAS